MRIDSPTEFPTRLDISLRLDGSLLEAVTRVNESIVAIGFDEVRFSPGGGAMPHVTLLMGEVATLEDFEKLSEAVECFSRATETFAISLGSPYLRESEGRWAFMDALPRERIRAIRFALHGVLAGLIELEPHGGPDNVSHVTVGYAESLQGDVEAALAGAAVGRGHASVVQLCAVGAHGTNVLRYREFALSPAKE
jgi:hypothetical protein